MLGLIKTAVVLAAVGYGAAYLLSARLPQSEHAGDVPAARAASLVPGPSSTTLAADPRGHFMATIGVDGMTVRAMVDTGASMLALTWEDAQKVGIRITPGMPTAMASTANGSVRYTRVRVGEARLNGLLLRDVEAAVMPKGALSVTLLGMSFLGRLSKVEIQRGRLVLEQ